MIPKLTVSDGAASENGNIQGAHGTQSASGAYGIFCWTSVHELQLVCGLGHPFALDGTAGSKPFSTVRNFILNFRTQFL